MKIGDTITWHESIRRRDKHGRRRTVGTRTLTGRIVSEGKSRRGAITYKIEVTAVAGDGVDIIGLVVSRKRRVMTHGRSWLRHLERVAKRATRGRPQAKKSPKKRNSK
ncbi:hypothetical protein [Novosphingobium mangrovi (ex Hu et al. 2023)]|uniref:Uncharacterized protein n=1 Tax=Novosphingobium mangrovi (ex Hu et al. 2023) TaxID=2930094 RepID=A0ABT0AGV9_9SPHN|nr:hypothetical protein [Novosphingobium mangrovi (ex Hu et al. 2023)]MCJ1962443.1 hypothetical protein [Novosphingobium mangrovi (ex Hu et al. 2023)]